MTQLSVAVVDNGDEFLVTTDTELADLLEVAASEAVAAGKLNVIFLYAPNRDHVTLVVGGNETVVGFNYGHGHPPYYASTGDAAQDSPILTAFVGLEHHTEFPRRWVVPMALGARAAREFLATGIRPSSVQWEEL